MSSHLSEALSPCPNKGPQLQGTQWGHGGDGVVSHWQMLGKAPFCTRLLAEMIRPSSCPQGHPWQVQEMQEEINDKGRTSTFTHL